MLDKNISAVDLNLLHVLCVVLEMRSATRAAAHLHVTQSAVSNALKRARALFDDPLVVRRPHGLEPTPRALALQPELARWVRQTLHILEGAPQFDPAQSSRTFRVACADAIAMILLPPLLRHLQARAPDVRLRLVTLDRVLAEDGLARGTVDLLVGVPPVVPPGHHAERVYEDPMACLVRRDHPTIRSRLTLDDFAATPHVDFALFEHVDETLDRALAKHGRTRTVRVALPHFSVVPYVVADSTCIATLSRRLATLFATRWPLRVLRPPLPLAPLAIQQLWHRRAENDEGVRFLRKLVLEAACTPGKRA
jgi:DNA-binding transcriptional LysR family regulator